MSLYLGLKSTQTWYLGRKKVSCLERCPYFRGVLIEGFHCSTCICKYTGNAEAIAWIQYTCSVIRNYLNTRRLEAINYCFLCAQFRVLVSIRKALGIASRDGAVFCVSQAVVSRREQETCCSPELVHTRTTRARATETLERQSNNTNLRSVHSHRKISCPGCSAYEVAVYQLSYQDSSAGWDESLIQIQGKGKCLN